eukprot:9479622-Pyramimonas_sp.AAC.1
MCQGDTYLRRGLESLCEGLQPARVAHSTTCDCTLTTNSRGEGKGRISLLFAYATTRKQAISQRRVLKVETESTDQRCEHHCVEHAQCIVTNIFVYLPRSFETNCRGGRRDTELWTAVYL